MAQQPATMYIPAMARIFKFPGLFCTFLAASQACLTAAAALAHPSLPDEVTINTDAGQLFVTLRLESGKELPFVVDTGAPITVIDKSFEPMLGKRLGTTLVGMVGGDQKKS